MAFGRLRYGGIALLTGTLLALASPASSAEHTLRFASISGETTAAYAKILEPYARAVERDSGGRIEVALKPSGAYGKPTELFSMVEKGEIEIAATVQGYSPGRFPQSSVIELPMIYDDAAAGSKALWGLYKEGLLDKDYASVKVLALYVSAPFSVMTTGKKIVTVKDLRGMRIRTPGPTVGMVLAKFGAIPLGIPVNLIGDSIASGTVDAIAFSVDSALTTKGAGDKFISDQLSVLFDAPFGAPAQMVVMNRAKWDSLPPDLQAALDKNAPIIINDGSRLRDELEVAAKQRVRSDSRFTVTTLTAEQRGELQHLMAPAYDDWKANMTKLGLDGERLLTRTRELVQKFKVASN